MIASSYSFAYTFLDFLQELLSTLVARLVAISWPCRGIRTSSKPFWNLSLWTLSLKALRSNDLMLLAPLLILRLRSIQTHSSSHSIDTVSKFYPPFIMFFTSINNQPYAYKAVFFKLKQIAEFETIIPIIATIITFVKCKL
jgi:hypothetical protein